MGELPSQTSFRLEQEFNGSYFGHDPANHHVLLVPTTGDRGPLDRSTGNLTLTFRPAVVFELQGTRFEAPAAILTCTDRALTPTFNVLAEDIARRTNANLERPAPRLVSRLCAEWEELLRRRVSLSRDEQLGLWGELWLLLRAPSLERAIAAWRGPSGAPIDLVGGGLGIECKTSMRRLEHHLSQAQVERPLGDTPIFIVSIWADRDEIGGQSLNDLVERIAKATGDPAAFERALLEAGYSRSDAAQYTSKLRVMEAPLWFEAAALPRVRAVDPGVSSVRYVATVDEMLALAPERGLSLLAQLCTESQVW